jgi:phosphoribosyl-AMP cyclohydrolase / phosphoribosyl-ATP pyrophosphohydrolase
LIRGAAELGRLDFARGGGTVTVVVQDAETGRVLMLAHADRAALERTLESGEMHFLSRRRGPWHKGATSGNVQQLVSLAEDCDGDAVLARVRPAGPACHTGSESCFGGESGDALSHLDAVVAARLEAPAEGSYTSRLLADRNLRLKKLGEEAVELALACAREDAQAACEEGADLLYHLLVAVRAAGGSLDGVRAALAARQAPAGAGESGAGSSRSTAAATRRSEDTISR